MCKLEDTLQKNWAVLSESQDLEKHGNTKGLSPIGEDQAEMSTNAIW